MFNRSLCRRCALHNPTSIPHHPQFTPLPSPNTASLHTTPATLRLSRSDKLSILKHGGTVAQLQKAKRLEKEQLNERKLKRIAESEGVEDEEGVVRMELMGGGGWDVKKDGGGKEGKSAGKGEDKKKGGKKVEKEGKFAKSGEKQAKKEREKWFENPYLLGAHVEGLVRKDRPDEAIAIVKRHIGASNSEVYGQLLAALGRKGLVEHVETVVKQMALQNKHISPQGYTSILTACGTLPKSTDPTRRRYRLTLAETTYDIIPNRTIHHINALLKVCAATLTEGGWEKAWQIYTSMMTAVHQQWQLEGLVDKDLGNARRKDERPLSPDVVTFATMINMCASKGGEEGYEYAMRVWEEFREYKPLPKTQGKKTYTPKKPTPNEYIIGGLILACTRSPNDAHAREGVMLARDYFACRVPDHLLPDGQKRKPPHPLDEKRPACRITTPVMNILMRLALRLNDPETAFAWFRYCSTKIEGPIDDGSYALAVSVLLSAGGVGRARQVAGHAKESGPLLLKVAAQAIQGGVGKKEKAEVGKKEKDGDKKEKGEEEDWMKVAMKAFGGVQEEIKRCRKAGEKVDVRPICWFLECLSGSGMWRDAGGILERYKEEVLEGTRELVEREMRFQGGRGAKIPWREELRFRLRRVQGWRDVLVKCVEECERQGGERGEVLRWGLLKERVDDLGRLVERGVGGKLPGFGGKVEGVKSGGVGKKKVKKGVNGGEEGGKGGEEDWFADVGDGKGARKQKHPNTLIEEDQDDSTAEIWLEPSSPSSSSPSTTTPPTPTGIATHTPAPRRTRTSILGGAMRRLEDKYYAGERLTVREQMRLNNALVLAGGEPIAGTFVSYGTRVRLPEREVGEERGAVEEGEEEEGEVGGGMAFEEEEVERVRREVRGGGALGRLVKLGEEKEEEWVRERGF
ncbi:hypothetical protein HDV00_002428 [Rhizophlyctis rosea]|nr:hypothetical protein HDV00_002428 [Rhizophlyctis rosea]